MSDAVAATEVTRPTYRGARIRHSATLIVAAMDHEQWLEQHDRMMADHEVFLKQHEEFIREHERVINRIDARLDRAIRDSIREARNERRKRRDLDEKITQLAAAQLVTEEKLQRLIDRDERRGGGNGSH